MVRKNPYRLKKSCIYYMSYKLYDIISEVLYLPFYILAIQFETVESQNWKLGESIK